MAAYRIWHVWVTLFLAGYFAPGLLTGNDRCYRRFCRGHFGACSGRGDLYTPIAHASSDTHIEYRGRPQHASARVPGMGAG